MKHYAGAILLVVYNIKRIMIEYIILKIYYMAKHHPDLIMCLKTKGLGIYYFNRDWEIM